MPTPTRLQSLSRWLARLCLVLMVLLPVAVLAAWANYDFFALEIVRRAGVFTLPEHLAVWQRIAGAAVMMVPAGIMVFGLASLRRLLVEIGAGAVFAIGNARYLRRFAWSAIAVIIVQFFATGALSAIITMANPPGQRSIVLQVGTDEILYIFVGLVFVLIAHVLEEGRRIADDNAAIV